MLIALLVVLGVDLVVIVAFVAAVLARKRWVRHQAGVFRGAIRVVDGQIDGLKASWSRGYGRWVHDVLVWSKAPFLFRTRLIAADELTEERAADPGAFLRLGDRPAMVRVVSGENTVEVAADGDHVDRLQGPFGRPADLGRGRTTRLG